MHGQGRSNIYHLGPEQITLRALKPGKKVSEQAKLDSVDNYANIYHFWASLAAQWLRIRLPMQGTRVRALVQEDATCCGATKPVRHNY